MLHGMETPTTRREDLILDKEKLEANGKLYQAAWATGLKLQKLHEPKKPSVISR
jgi:hypothetical protein